MKKLSLIILISLLFVPVALSQELKLDINLEILTYEINDAYVVGDSFYYRINLTNTGNETINDTFTVAVLNPNRELLDKPKTYQKLIEPNSSILIVAEGGRKNETAIFIFDIQGDYKIEINSTQPIDFYRWLTVREENILYKRYIRQNQNFKYFFDVMPRWQYSLWKDTEKANRKIFDANQKLLDLTIDLNNATKIMKDATKSIETATWVMLVVAVITLCVAYKSYKTAKYRAEVEIK